MPANSISMKSSLVLVVVGILFMILSGCRPIEVTPTAALETRTPGPTITAIPTLTETATQIPTATPSTPTITPQAYEVCSPLEDETFDSLPLILTNPLVIPPFGQDTGHHGVDFAYYRRGDRESIEGIEIYAILSGETVLTLDDDIPYGYTLLIETPLSDLPESIQNRLMAGYLPVPDDPNYRLNCPDVRGPTLTGKFSVYHLYAHMEVRPSFTHGDPVQCGERLGTVGNSGYSSNPHLHLETRLGPAGAEFRTMAHYEPTNTIEQISNYCLWRMSGHYQLFDPFILFEAAE
jgi:murein DD-endopeptidase MepM/ murein hydrolase activator NlpD